jgi:cytochrome c oxidase cbb3-type subunit 3
MSSFFSRCWLAAAALIAGAASLVAAQTPQKTDSGYPAALIESGHSLFQQDCAFCHGRDAGGGETGPDLIESPVVASDLKGDKIGEVVRNGRPDKGMPRFSMSDQDLAGIVAFIHEQKARYEKHPGGRRRVDEADLQTGNAEAGKQYFNGPGTCSKCHSPTGDLAGIARRFKGLKLEMRFLYPREERGEKTSATATVTLPSGETVKGKLAYHDEFTIGIRDDNGWYRAWPVARVKYKIDAPVEAHANLLGKYTDDDIHNLMAYLQTLR